MDEEEKSMPIIKHAIEIGYPIKQKNQNGLRGI